MSLPAFIDIDVVDQMLELRAHLKSMGAEISEQNTDKGGIGDLVKITEASSVYWKTLNNDEEIETLLNGIISLIIWFPLKDTAKVISLFCEKIGDMSENDTRGALRIQLLRNLFHYVEEKSPLRYEIYFTMVKLASQSGLMTLITTDLSQLKKWFKIWQLNVQEQQRVLRLLHEGLSQSKHSEIASKVMVELLGTYTDENASQARNETHRCIVKCLSDPDTYFLDHLLPLKPVKFLEGELIHDLLTIFVSGTLHQYRQFHKNNPDSISEMGLSHEQNIRKMRLLTFIQMAEGERELDFAVIQDKLGLTESEVEEFIIEAVRTKTVRAKIDLVNKNVLVDYTVNRSFGRPQWQQLRQNLNQWNTNLSGVLIHLDSLFRS